jgi:N-acetylmuramoyl-L-alanine amidase
MFSVYFFFTPGAEPQDLIASDGNTSEFYEQGAPIAPIIKPVKPQLIGEPRVNPKPPPRVGIIAGHRGSDSGTECQDGLTEVEITSQLAEKVGNRIRAMGIPTDILDEFDERLDNYTATALISIHVDSCDYINELATGFKIAGSPYTDSSQLSICMQQAYANATALPYHPNSITPHMANYHAFGKINLNTPALIIEVGFLNLDRDLLTTDSDILVEGLVNGISCYLEQQLENS